MLLDGGVILRGEFGWRLANDAALSRFGTNCNGAEA